MSAHSAAWTCLLTQLFPQPTTHSACLIKVTLLHIKYACNGDNVETRIKAEQLLKRQWRAQTLESGRNTLRTFHAGNFEVGEGSEPQHKFDGKFTFTAAPNVPMVSAFIYIPMRDYAPST